MLHQGSVGHSIVVCVLVCVFRAGYVNGAAVLSGRPSSCCRETHE